MIDGGGVQELAALPPGPALAAALAAVDPGAVPNGEIVDLMVAQSRQLAHDQARLWSVINEVLHRRPFTPVNEVHRSEFPELFAADEVRAALTWTRRAAEAETDLAFVLAQHLPLVLQAVSEGSIDRGRAVVFARHLADLTAEQATVICSALLPVAPRLTTGQLAERIKRMILEIDPAYYDARYRKALQERRVVHYLDADGAAVVTARGLPAAQAAAAMRRVDDLARAARRAGHPATLDQIRADVFLVLLDGSVHGLSREQIITALIDRHVSEVVAEQTPGEPGGGRADGAGSGPGGDQRVGIEIRVPLITLIGEAERAGELPGLGPVTAATARRAVQSARRAQWRWAVVDTGGRLLTEGVTRRRPADLSRNGPRGGIVELQITEADLNRLAGEPASCGPWAGVITDVADQHRRHRRPEHGAELDDHPEARFPRAALRRHVEIRDRTCCAPGCRAPAASSDIDHTVEYSDGGPTVRADLGPACRHDHTLKTSGGWGCEQPEPGRFVWTSPLGRTYDVRPEPILPPPVAETSRPPDPHHDQPAADVERPLLAEPGPPRAPPATAPPPGTKDAGSRPLHHRPASGRAGDTEPPPF